MVEVLPDPVTDRRGVTHPKVSEDARRSRWLGLYEQLVARCHTLTVDKNLLKLLSLSEDVTTLHPGWVCPNCQQLTPLDQMVCATCRARKPQDSRARLASYPTVLDTKSFVLPVQRSIVRTWILISLIPIAASLFYFLVRRFL
jgi:hypothetical protein